MQKWIRFRDKWAYGDGKWRVAEFPGLLEQSPMIEVREYIEEEHIPWYTKESERYRGVEFEVIDESQLTIEELQKLIRGYANAIAGAQQRIRDCSEMIPHFMQLVEQKRQEDSHGDTAK